MPFKPNKMRNVPTVVDGVRFASKKEARRWAELRLLERGGVIRDLKRQHRIEIVANGVKVTTAIVDFRYYEDGVGVVLEDVKGRTTDLSPNTQLWKLKFALLKALYGMEVKIT